MSNEIDLRKQRKIDATLDSTGLATEATLLSNTDILSNILTEITNMGSDKYYTLKFTSALSISISGVSHNFARIPDIDIYDIIGQKVFAQTLIDVINFNITINFNRLQSGVIILT